LDRPPGGGRGTQEDLSVESRPVFANLSPIDHRYSIAEPELFGKLSTYLSEEAVVRSCARVEEALLEALVRRLAPEGRRAALAAAVAGVAGSVDPADVYAEEAKTRHNVRALVNVMKRIVPPEAGPYVHLGATSADILDTAASLRYRDVTCRVLLPLLADLEEALVRLARAEADTPQIGRTHGQYAVPITFGFAVAGYVSRLGKCILRMRDRVADLRGKLSGAVGAYNAGSPSSRTRKRSSVSSSRGWASRRPTPRPSSSSRSTFSACSSRSTPPSELPPTSPTTCGTSSARRSGRCARSSRKLRSVRPPCPRSATPGMQST